MPPPPMTRSESLVFKLCERSFLSLWSYPRPLRSDGRELCDVLVLCEPDIIVFSVKEIAAHSKGDPSVGWKRWQRKAIDASVAQLYGAERALARLDHVVQENGSRGLPLPPATERRVHLVAVAAGGRRQVPIYSGDFGKGYVHVFDEISLAAVLQELDTIGDFVSYLAGIREFHDRGGRAVASGEEQLLALYIHRGRSLPSEVDVLITDDSPWAEIQKKPEWLARKAEDRSSYIWDRLIETLLEEHLVPIRAGEDVSDLERVVRTMARETRFARRVLANGFRDWIQTGQAGARLMRSPLSGVAYVFLTAPRDLPRQARANELAGRCYVARQLHEDSATVIGIGTEVYDPAGFSFDAVYLHMPDWSDADERTARNARQKFGWFHSPEVDAYDVYEFPNPTVQNDASDDSPSEPPGSEESDEMIEGEETRDSNDQSS